MTREQAEKAETIALHYGEKNQRLILIEEVGELLQAIGKLERYGDRKHFVEELADVFIMVQQMRLLLSEEDNDFFNRTVDYKLNRQIERIEKEVKAE